MKLTESLRGADVLYNTYWVRFNHPGFTHAEAVTNTRRLFDAAKRAGVRRVVHVSITNPSEDSPLEYFRGKAELERSLIESTLSYAILRPAVLFGGEDILINNIAWALRRFPVFAVFGSGDYKLQPIHVDDFAAIAVEQGRSSAMTRLSMQSDRRRSVPRASRASRAHHREAEADRFGPAIARLLGSRGDGVGDARRSAYS